MEANEAPEKIYLTTFGFPLWEPIPEESSCPDTVWSTKPYEDADSIEYTRTDAFIEKACEWLKNNVEKYYYLDEAYDKVISIKNLNNDFKKYMEELEE